MQYRQHFFPTNRLFDTKPSRCHLQVCLRVDAGRVTMCYEGELSQEIASFKLAEVLVSASTTKKKSTEARASSPRS